LLVLEVHEEAVPEVKSFREFAAALRDLDVRLAFDDFGAGQSRLLELSQVLPDYLKFDRSLVKDLGSDAAHAGLVSSLHKSATALGITTLAEGLETPESIAACQELGFTLFQGFAFGRPQPIDQCVATHDRR
jgi:EAL domain-containing protein (putative c-di-GMP-specific phosphodiesterase class I)